MSAYLAAALLVLAALIAYHNSFSVPFLYDDVTAVVTNTTIRDLWPMWPILTPPADTTTSGRPLLNLSLAINHSISGLNVWSYHAVNVAIHILCGLTLFGIVRRTLLSEPLRPRFASASLLLALSIAALWTLHPLQTESVTYIVQRAESLMGLFYLLTLYSFIRGTDAGATRIWHVATVFFCLLGMASKEVMVSAPLMVLLYDRTFIAGSFRDAWLRRRGLYLALAATWLLLGYLVVTTGNRSGSAGFNAGMSSWTYALTQFKAITLYLRLSFWPSPLIFDYGIVVAKNFAEVAVYAVLILTLAALTLIGLWRWAAVGFVGIWFFAILAPSSSIVPVVTETFAEHRMYLPLAAVITLIVLAVYAKIGRRSLPVFFGAAILFGGFTIKRNEVYQTGMALWTDNLAKRPENPRAHNQMGNLLAAAGNDQEAFRHFEEALRLKPTDSDAHYNIATAFLRQGRLPDALTHFEEALRLKPDHVDSYINYGIVLMRSGRAAEAIPMFERALVLKPSSAPTLNNLGIALAQTGRLNEALPHFEAAARADPKYAEAQNNWGNGLRQTGHASEAIAHFQEALRLLPNYAEAHNNLALTYDEIGRLEEAVTHYQKVLQLEPTYADGHYNLANALLRLNRRAEAIDHLQETLRLQPDHANALAKMTELRSSLR